MSVAGCSMIKKHKLSEPSLQIALSPVVSLLNHSTVKEFTMPVV
jgi:hypothetical protein